MKFILRFWKQQICAIFLVVSSGSYAQTAVPDPAFEQYLIDDGFDSDGIINGQISAEDAIAVNVVNVDVATYPITDFTGLEDFINVNVFYSDGIDYETINLSTLTNLEFLSILGNSTLNALDVSNNSALKEFLILGTIGVTPITEIDVSQNLNLTTLQLRNLQALNTIVYPSDPTILQYIWFQNLSLSVLDFSSFDSLIEIIICCNTDVTIPIILPSEIENLSGLYLENLELNTIDVSPYINLEILMLTYASLTDLDISQNTKLKSLDVSFNQLEDLEIINDYYNHRLNDGLIDKGRFLRLRENNFSGRLPNFNNLVYNNDPTDRTENFILDLRNNRFQFGDFEEDHFNYLDRTTISWPEGGVTPFLLYLYAGQQRVDEEVLLSETAGATVVLSCEVRGVQNHYRWFKDNEELVTVQDAPELTLFNVTPCDAGTYYALVTSDLVPFEADGIPGNNGRNLELRRNDIIVVIEDSTTPICPMLITPIDGAVNVPVTTGISWETVTSACGYVVRVTSADGAVIVDDEDIPNTQITNFGNLLPENTEITVTITPYFVDGSSLACETQSFTTGTDLEIADCPTLLYPTNKSNDVPVDTLFIWEEGNGADSYFLEIGTSSGDNNIFSEDVGSTSPIALPMDQSLPENTTLFATLSAINEAGMTIPCAEIRFTTEQLPPSCVTLVTPGPENGDINVPVDASFFWTEAPTADSYLLSVGPISGSSAIFGPENVGNVLTYDLPFDLQDGIEVFVNVVPVNEAGKGLGCENQSFITATELPLPECSELTLPRNGDVDVPIDTNLEWGAVATAQSYVVTIGTTSNGTDVYNDNVGNFTTLNLPEDLETNQEYFVTITPINESGEAMNCEEAHFTTIADTLDIGCTELLTPKDGDIDVPLDTILSWNPVALAEGYLINVGTTAGGTDIFNQEEVINSNQLQPNQNLPEGLEIFVTIIPFTSDGISDTCEEEVFFTVNSVPEEPIVSRFGFSPDGDSVNDFWTIPGIEEYPDNAVAIYNRWGDQVFEMRGYDNSSNVFRGNANKATGRGAGELPDGTYFFTINIPIDNNIAKAGYVVLKR